MRQVVNPTAEDNDRTTNQRDEDNSLKYGMMKYWFQKYVVDVPLVLCIQRR